MNFTLWASPSEIAPSCLESLPLKNLKLVGSKSSCRVGDFSRKESTSFSHDVRKLVISSRIVPGQLDGSFMGKKHMEGGSRKLEYVRTLLIDNYDSYTYNVYQELSVINGVPPLVVRNDEWSWEEICHYLYEERAFDNIVISPGPGSPTCPEDIGVCLRLLLECRDIPILGVCLGHQVPDRRRLFKGIPRNTYFVNNADEAIHFNSCNGVNPSNVSNGKKYLKLKWRKFEGLASEVGGARNIFVELFGQQKAENSFWLDSSSTEKERARFSFLGGKGGSLWKQVTFKLIDQSDMPQKRGGYLSTKDAHGSTTTTFLEDGFFDFLNKELQSFYYEEKDYERLPFDFYGGYIGYLGYGLKVECNMSVNLHKDNVPAACFFFADNFVVIDHCHDDVYILSIHDGCTNTGQWLDDVETKLLSLKASGAKELLPHCSRSAPYSPIQPDFVAEKSREQYIEDVEKCQKFIKDGESYELCLTNQMRKKIGDTDSMGLYLNLREKNPAPYAAWLNFSTENLCICCSSPERFLRLDRKGILEAKPIKGTIGRSATSEEDELLKLQLQYSEKDQAENLMIVDLLRNDLGRVCEPGSVHVPSLMEVESYATVHTMVSTIRGKKLSSASAVDCVRAAFPGGSMTGAPKLRSMELLDSLETSSRGIYSGCIGYFSYNQTFDLNIVIRTVVIHEGEASVGAGGAIVALSNPEEEYKEMLLKTRAPVNAVMEHHNNGNQK